MRFLQPVLYVTWGQACVEKFSHVVIKKVQSEMNPSRT